MNQVMLESKRPILVGDLKAAGSINDQITKPAESDGLTLETKIGSKNGSEVEGADPKIPEPSEQGNHGIKEDFPQNQVNCSIRKNLMSISKDNSALNSVIDRLSHGIRSCIWIKVIDADITPSL